MREAFNLVTLLCFIGVLTKASGGAFAVTYNGTSLVPIGPAAAISQSFSSIANPDGSGSEFAIGTAILNPGSSPRIGLSATVNSQGFDGESAEAWAGFTDTLNVQRGPTQGYFEFFYALTGKYNFQFGQGGAFLQLAYGNGNPVGDPSDPATFLSNLASNIQAAPLFVNNGPQLQIGGSGAITLDQQAAIVPYSNSTATFFFAAQARADCTGYTSNLESSPCFSDVLFGNTVALTGVRILDANSNVVTDSIVTSASGFNWNNLPAFQDVPEPSPFWLLTTVLLMVYFYRGCKLKRG